MCTVKVGKIVLKPHVKIFLLPCKYFQVGKFIQEYAAVYLTAALESVMEEVLSRALLLCGGGAGHEVTTALLEHGIATSPDLWGIFQVTTCLLSYCDHCVTHHLTPTTAAVRAPEQLPHGEGRAVRAGLHQRRAQRHRAAGGGGGGQDREPGEGRLISTHIYLL